jgi:hypothetical protein
MRTFLVLICSFALACAAAGAQKEDKSKKPKKNQAQSAQHATAPAGESKKNKGAQHVTAAAGHPAGNGGQKTKGKANGSQYVATTGGNSASAAAYKTKQKPKGSQQIAAQGGRPAGGGPSYQKTKGSQYLTAAGGGAQKTKGKMKGSHQIAAQQSSYYNAQKTKKTKVTATSATGFQSGTKTYKAKHFNFSVNTRPTTVAAVTFQQNRRIVGSQNWQGQNYWAFRNYQPVWHERNWWNSHYNRVVFVFGGWYYWNAGWWYPAWGYAPNAYYAYDGPIYAYNGLPPDQVIANVQATLQQQGYYQGGVDGLLGPLTRAAIADYQRDHELYITSAIDRPTLESLGMT